jgi:hypothetical protein
VIPLAELAVLIWLPEQGRKLFQLQVVNRSFGRALARDAENRGTLPGGERLSIRNESKEAVKSGKPAVPCGNGCAAIFLDMIQAES